MDGMGKMMKGWQKKMQEYFYEHDSRKEAKDATERKNEAGITTAAQMRKKQGPGLYQADIGE